MVKYGDANLQWQNVYIKLSELQNTVEYRGFTETLTGRSIPDRSPVRLQSPNLYQLSFLEDLFLDELNADGTNRSIGIGIVIQSAPGSANHSALVQKAGEHVAWIYSAASHDHMTDPTDFSVPGHISGFAPTAGVNESFLDYDEIDSSKAVHADAHDEWEGSSRSPCFRRRITRW